VRVVGGICLFGESATSRTTVRIRLITWEMTTLLEEITSIFPREDKGISNYTEMQPNNLMDKML